MPCARMLVSRARVHHKTAEEWLLIQVGSRFLSEAETRYAVVEMEMLAVSWAIMIFRLFLIGLQHFDVISDHNLLISIHLIDREPTATMDEIENPRLQRLKAQIMGYNFTVQWTKGSNHHAPDALSCHPTRDPSNKDTVAETDPQLCPEVTISEIRTLSCMGFTLPTRLQDLAGQSSTRYGVPGNTQHHPQWIPNTSPPTS